MEILLNHENSLWKSVEILTDYGNYTCKFMEILLNDESY